MPLSPGDKLGPYEMLTPIGAGGMGTVWKASDTRLGRTVAIKFVEGRFSERFEREAKTIASLNHPHICTLFDVGENYLVLEHIEGSPLKGPLPAPEVIRLGAQIADALDAAHRKGITHRDLKPGNVLVTNTGGAKVIDFGLAKAASAAISLGDNDATLTKPLTSEGTILGTVPYMSPEQLQGHEADARSDIFALGCVLYEMLTGRRAFEGKSQVSIMAAILENEPAPLTEPVVPAWLDRIIRRCLRKNPDDRWQSARDVAIELREPPQTARGSEPPPRSRIWPWVVATAVSIALAALAWLGPAAMSPAAPRSYSFRIQSPGGGPVYGRGASISPDGRYITYLAIHQGRPHLWLHSLESGEARPLPGTEDGSFPFWSPNGGSLGFFSYGKLRRLDLASGGSARTLCDAPMGRGGSWGEDGHIIFAPGAYGPLQRVPDGGGVPAAVTAIRPDETSVLHRFPTILPGGRKLLFSINRNDNEGTGIHVADLGTDGRAGSSRLLIPTTSNSVFASSQISRTENGYILWASEDRERNLLARPFRLSDATFTGGIEPINGSDQLSLSGFAVAYTFAASRQGTLLWGSNDPARPQRSVVNRSGKLLFRVEPGPSTAAIFAPDGRRMAYSRIGAELGVWIHDSASHRQTRVTFAPPRSSAAGAIWSPSGTAIYYSEGRVGSFALRRKKLAGAAAEETLTAIGNLTRPLAVSPDERFLLIQLDRSSRDIGLLPLDGTGRPSVFLAGPANEQMAEFSPDGRWVVYESDESGIPQIYITAFTGTAAGNGKLQVTRLGGKDPRWRGSELFFIGLDGKVFVSQVQIRAGGPEAGPPVALFDSGLTVGAGAMLDVSPDGQRFSLGAGEISQSLLRVVTSWSGGR